VHSSSNGDFLCMYHLTPQKPTFTIARASLVFPDIVNFILNWLINAHLNLILHCCLLQWKSRNQSHSSIKTWHSHFRTILSSLDMYTNYLEGMIPYMVSSILYLTCLWHVKNISLNSTTKRNTNTKLERFGYC